MPVYKKNNKWYARLNYTDALGNNKQVQSKYFDTKREAQEELANMQVQHKQVKSRITFNDVFEEYLKDQLNKVKPITHSHYKPLYDHIKNLIGNIPIQSLTIQQYKTIKDELNKTDLSTSRKNRIHKFIVILTKCAYQNYGIINDVPSRVGGFNDPAKIKEEIQYFNENEFKKFRDEFFDDIVYYTLFGTLFYEGLRIGEALALTWHDIDLEGNFIHVNKTYTSKLNVAYKKNNYSITSPKTPSSNRTIPIEKELSKDLRQLKDYYKEFDFFCDDWFVFGGFKPLSETTITAKKNEACKNAELKQITIHQFRHSCISYLANNGVDPLSIQSFVGHSKLSTTMDIYTHIYKNKLGNIFSFKN